MAAADDAKRAATAADDCVKATPGAPSKGPYPLPVLLQYLFASDAQRQLFEE